MDDFLENRGRWHWLILTLNAYIAVPHSWFVMAPSFMAPSKQDFWCTSGWNASTTAPVNSTGDFDARCYTNATGRLEKCTQWAFDTEKNARTLQMDVSTHQGIRIHHLFKHLLKPATQPVRLSI